MFLSCSADSAKWSDCELFVSLLSPELRLNWDDPQSRVPTYENYLLAVTESDEIVLALVPYLAVDAHKNARNAIENISNRPLRLIIGAGELHRNENGQFDQANDTSGFVGLSSSLDEVERVLRENNFLAPSFEKKYFANSGSHIHLDDRLNSTDGSSVLRNIRHEANNEMNALFLSVNLAIQMTSVGGAEPYLKRLRELETTSISKYISLLTVKGNTGPEFTHPRIQVVQRWLSEIRQGDNKSLLELKALYTHLRAIDRGLKDPAVRIIKLGKWDGKPLEIP